MATASTHRLLLIEDHEPLARQLLATLGDAGYELKWVRRGDDALAIDVRHYQLVILDLILPGASGFDVLTHLQQRGDAVPVVIMSNCCNARHRRSALALGATDYVAKPFWPGELLERVAAQLRRRTPEPRCDAIDIGTLTVDVTRRRALRGGADLYLTRSEFAILASLARRRGAAVSRASLLLEITEWEPDATPELIDVYVSRLVGKIGDAGARIRTVWGVGYRLDAADDRR